MPASMTVAEANLAALAAVTACKAGMYGEVLRIGNGNPWAFASAVAVAERLADEVNRLGGDSAALLERIYRQSCGMPAAPDGPDEEGRAP